MTSAITRFDATPPSAANNDKYAEFAPGGVASNRVMAEVNRHVVLVPATGAPNQKWVFNGTGSSWTNVATGDVLRELGPGFAGGHLKPFPIRPSAILPLEEAKAAYLAVAGSSRDRVILRP